MLSVLLFPRKCLILFVVVLILDGHGHLQLDSLLIRVVQHTQVMLDERQARAAIVEAAAAGRDLFQFSVLAPALEGKDEPAPLIRAGLRGQAESLRWRTLPHRSHLRSFIGCLLR